MYELFYLSENPYFKDEIPVLGEESVLFEGRHEENLDFIYYVGMQSKGGVITVGGTTGVGKSSFVNHNQKVVFKKQWEQAHPKINFEVPHLIPCISKIQLENSETLASVFYQALKRTFFSIELAFDHTGEQIPASIINLNKKFNDFSTSDTNILLNIRAGILEAGFSKSSSVDKSQGESDKLDEYIDIMERLLTAVRHETKYDGIFLVIDNMDRKSPEYVIEFLDSAREIFSRIKYIWWVLLGFYDFHEFLLTKSEGLDQILHPKSINLKKIGRQEFLKIIDSRYNFYKIKDSIRYIKPISDESLMKLYSATIGDIRFIFSKALYILQKAHQRTPARSTVREEFLVEIVKIVTSKKINNKINNQAERRIMRRFIQNSSIKYIRISDYSEYEFDDPDAFRVCLENMALKRLFAISAKSNGVIKYLGSGYTMLARYFGIADELFNY